MSEVREPDHAPHVGKRADGDVDQRRLSSRGRLAEEHHTCPFRRTTYAASWPSLPASMSSCWTHSVEATLMPRRCRSKYSERVSGTGLQEVHYERRDGQCTGVIGGRLSSRRSLCAMHA